MKTFCFTGYRPNKLYGYDWKQKGNQKIILSIKEVVVSLIEKHDCIKFICGGALGIDQMAFEVVYKIKSIYPNKNIQIELAIPFKGYEKKWFNEKDINRFKNAIKKADIVTYVDEKENYQFNDNNLSDLVVASIKNDKRNHYMIDNSDCIISVFDFKTISDNVKSGTKNCVKAALQKNKEIININPYSFKLSFIKEIKVKIFNTNNQISLF